MKTPFGIYVVVAFSLFGAGFLYGAPTAASQQTPAIPSPTPYSVVQRDANSRVWQRLTYQTSPSGQVVTNVHRYVELATGLHYWSNDQWLESKEEIDILPQGGAAATKGQHQAKFPGDIAQGVIELVTPDGKNLQSRPIGLSYDDGSNTVLIAELTNSDGYLASSNQVIYPNAFEGVAASLRYTYKKSGFEQDVLIEGQLPTPETYGLNPATTRLQVLTEFFDTNSPVQATGRVNPQNGLSDTILTFGTMKMVQGRAFSIGDTNQIQFQIGGTPTYKSWLHLNGRTFLMEEVTYQGVAPQLKQLPASASTVPTKTSAKWVLNKVSPLRLLPPTRMVQASTNRVQLAKADFSRERGVVLDYVAVNDSLTNYTFQGDMTYLVSGEVDLYGTTTIEGGTVVKYTHQGFGLLFFYGPINCQTAAYRPAIFTAMDDDSVGEPISGSTGVPSGIYASWALVYYNPPFSTLLQNLEFKYAFYAVNMESGNSNVLRNIQFVNDSVPFYSYYCTNDLQNILMYNVSVTCFYELNSSVSAENVTLHDTSGVWINDSPPSTLTLTNSLLISAGDLLAPFTGAYNATNSSDTGIFQTVGAGSHYLADGSPYRNAGTRNIDATLLAQLAQKTTYPPIVYNIPGVYFSTNLNLFPQAQRDTNSAPDLGYHYDPLDYLFGPVYVTNATIIINPGTVVAIYGTNSYTYGFAIADNAQFLCQGSPNNLSRMVEYNTVQEQVPIGWNTTSYALVAHFNGLNATINCRFTDWSVMAQDVPHVRVQSASTPINLQDCQFHGGQLITSYPTINLTNCLLERVNADLEPLDDNIPVIRNNLIWGGTFGFGPSQTNAVVTDNLFDRATIPDWLGGVGTPYVGGHNAYVTNCDMLDPSYSTDVILSNPLVYQAGPLGNYYQPANSLLINAGSTNADKVGLYHYTTQTNQVKETNSVVDIGYHYVATDAYGNPRDTDGDGIPDYVEDANGNGVYDTGELSDWTKFSTDGTGMSDGWEIRYFGHTGIAPNDDRDGDGLSNMQEYLLGTNPTVDDSTQSGSRLNYIYDPGGWLQTVSGTHSGSISPDSEGNIKIVSQ